MLSDVKITKKKEGERNLALNYDNFSEEAKQVLSTAKEEAERLKHNYIGTEHLLLGILADQKDPACQVLGSFGVDRAKALRAVEFMIGKGEKEVESEIFLTPRAKKAINLAVEQAEIFESNQVTPLFLLIGLIKESEGLAVGILESVGVNLSRLYIELEKRNLLGLEKFGQELLKRRKEEVKNTSWKKAAGLGLITGIALLYYFRRKSRKV